MSDTHASARPLKDSTAAEKPVLVSERFQDVYFSADGGLAETRHVFLEGNDLPNAWQGKTEFTIAETGFGTGLNCLAACSLFQRTAPADARLHYIAWEKFPLAAEQIRQTLEPWASELDGLLERLLAVYPTHIPADPAGCCFELDLSSAPASSPSSALSSTSGYGSLRLSLVIDDVNVAMPRMQACVDAWFLDGFMPARNPDMWSETVFREMARMSPVGATLATFTSAGFVRRGLEAAGFTVERRPGHGRKRHMSVGWRIS